MGWIWSEDYEQDYVEFMKKYPMGSDGYRKVTMVCGWCELVGALYKNKLLNKDLLYDCWGFRMGWERVKGFCLGEREKYKNPHIWENLELLAMDEPG
jgi:hypothetical protein